MTQNFPGFFLSCFPFSGHSAMGCHGLRVKRAFYKNNQQETKVGFNLPLNSASLEREEKKGCGGLWQKLLINIQNLFSLPSSLTKPLYFGRQQFSNLQNKKKAHFPFFLAMVWPMKYRQKMLDGVFWNILHRELTQLGGMSLEPCPW